MRVAVNGLGSIGRRVVRSICERKCEDIEIVSINDLADLPTLANLYENDTKYGRYPGGIAVKDGHLILDDRKIRCLSGKSPATLPWKDLEIDLVVESTGRFCNYGGARQHLKAGAKRVLLTALPGLPKGYSEICRLSLQLAALYRSFIPNSIPVFVVGVNEESLNPRKHHLVSNGSCGLNTTAHIVDCLQKRYGVEDGFFQIIHGSEDVCLQGGAQPLDPKLTARNDSSEVSRPTRTGTYMRDVIAGLRRPMRSSVSTAPVASVSLLDLTLHLRQSADNKEVGAILSEVAHRRDSVIAVRSEPPASLDFSECALSAVVDLASIQCRENVVRLNAWFDHEWGFANRVVDLIQHMNTAATG